MFSKALNKLFLSDSEKNVIVEKCTFYEVDFESDFSDKYCWIYPDKHSCPSEGRLKKGCCPKYGIPRNQLFQEFAKNRSWKGLEEALQNIED